MLSVIATTTAAAIAAGACSDSSTSTVSLDPPHLNFYSIAPVGASAWTPGGAQDCVQLGSDPHRSLVVNVGPRSTKPGVDDGTGHLYSPSNPPVSWTISSPQTCVGTPPCGFLRLSVSPCTTSDVTSCSDPSQVVVSAGPSITVSFDKDDAGASTAFDQFYRFRVVLYNQDATRAVDRNGKTYPADTVVEVKSQCGTTFPPLSDGGAGHPFPDAGRDAIAPPADGAMPAPRDAGPPAPPDATTGVDAAPPLTDSGAPLSDGAVVGTKDAAPRADSGPRIPADARTP